RFLSAWPHGKKSNPGRQPLKSAPRCWRSSAMSLRKDFFGTHAPVVGLAWGILQPGPIADIPGLRELRTRPIGGTCCRSEMRFASKRLDAAALNDRAHPRGLSLHHVRHIGWGAAADLDAELHPFVLQFRPVERPRYLGMQALDDHRRRSRRREYRLVGD